MGNKLKINGKQPIQNPPNERGGPVAHSPAPTLGAFPLTPAAGPLTFLGRRVRRRKINRIKRQILRDEYDWLSGMEITVQRIIDESPVYVIGQGDYRRDINADDIGRPGMAFVWGFWAIIIIAIAILLAWRGASGLPG